VAQICIEAAYDLSEDVCTAFDRAQETETAPAAKAVIGLLKENARIAREDRIPICQDTASPCSSSRSDRTCGSRMGPDRRHQ